MYIIMMSLQRWLLASYTIFVLVIVVLMIYFITIYNDFKNISKSETQINTLLTEQLKMNQAFKNFISDEAFDTLFYKTEKSVNLELFLKSIDTYKNISQALVQNQLINNSNKSSTLSEATAYQSANKILIQKLVSYQRKRGFKDYGIEGNLRNSIHNIEQNYKKFDLVQLLTLRRVEKDYFLRRDLTYAIRLLNYEKTCISKKYYTNVYTEKALKTDLSNYFSWFKEVVSIDKLIGLTTNSGLKNEISNNFNASLLLLNKAQTEYEDYITNQYRMLELKCVVAVVITIVLCLILAFVVSKRITSPLKNLVSIVDECQKCNFNIEPNFESGSKVAEINTLQLHLKYMFDSITTHILDIEIHLKEVKNLNSLYSDTNKKLEDNKKELEKSIKLRETFISVISHDIRGPLNTLKGFLNIIIEHPQILSEDDKKINFEKIRESTDLQINLLNNLLSWSKSHTTQIEYHPIKVNIMAKVFDTIRLFEPQISAKNIKLTNEINNIDTWADPNITELILRNLLSNAIKFTSENGKITIINTTQGNYVWITIKDTGIGISEENMRMILKSPGQLTNEGTSSEKGSGFGLFFCKEFVEKIGGSFTIDSIENMGTQISFSMPLFVCQKDVKKSKEKIF